MAEEVLSDYLDKAGFGDVSVSDNLGWRGPKSHSTEPLKNGTVGLWPSSTANVAWASLPSAAEASIPELAQVGDKQISPTSSYYWSAYQFLPAPTSSSSLHQITRSPSVIQEEPKIESTSETQLLNPEGLEGTSESSNSSPFIIQESDSLEGLSDEETTDTEDHGEDGESESTDHRSVILHLISQLRFGMDLTKVVFPTFILEKRSLLEMFANFMAHPDLLLSIGSGATPEDRAISFVEYYLTSFHEGRKGSVAKKPYNPIIGETFLCSWDVPQDRIRPLQREKIMEPEAEAKAKAEAEAEAVVKAEAEPELYKLRFVAEQVSHHPPVSCFYCECKEKGLFVNTHVWTKSKFMGMSVGVSLIGEGTLRLTDYEEDYVFTLPSAYARSILTIPWVELGGKVTMNCAKTGYSALVVFHTKPFYGGKVHRVTAEVKHDPTNTIVCKAQGEWNGILEFTYSSGQTKVVNTATLPVYPKKIRPIDKQGPMESRNLWRDVTSCMREGNMSLATEFKRHLEDQQRKDEQNRAELKVEWQPKYFRKEGNGWVFAKHLWTAQ
ncbi:oxysterol-binding protein-related protein 10 [Gracilinanus agilis]|uniref:oxysterol-binding protein-related protein 10 n=1 Tax=Gracilinanus agilis TaxID=191870 RepID=UPI001CFD751B|nr:oxysterol-binding protein-related protein 10 [Gracilinanus agilis]